jgi:hypothetical protein
MKSGPQLEKLPHMNFWLRILAAWNLERRLTMDHLRVDGDYCDWGWQRNGLLRFWDAGHVVLVREDFDELRQHGPVLRESISRAAAGGVNVR